MAEVNPAEISAILKKQLKDFDSTSSLNEIGSVLTVGDGIARAYGLSNAQYGELVEFSNGTQGIVLNLEEDNVGIVLLGSSTDIKEATVITASPINEYLKSIILSKINISDSKSISLTNIIDSSIIGGFIIRFDGKEYNASVKQNLNNLKKELTN